MMLAGLAIAATLAPVNAPAIAHEVRPAIADVEVVSDRLDMELRLAIEAMVAGIDLEGLADTNDSPLASDYDDLRALGPDALEEKLRAAWPRLRNGFRFETGGQSLRAEITGITIPEPGDVSLARDTMLSLEVKLPQGDEPVRLGWDAAFGPLVVRQMEAGEDAYTGYLTGGAMSEPLPRTGVAREGTWQVAARYLVIGFEHIVPKGLDHILFVLGLFFLSLSLRPLLIQVTAFTIAHTLTLALAMLGLVSVPPAIVEPLIAASIVYVAVENVMRSSMTRWRTAVVFGFGLLHGLGFASVLGEIGLDPARFAVGLISFNVGVELGQLSVIAAAFVIVGAWFRHKSWYRGRITVPASVAIAAVGAFWFVERVAG
ncbi:MAG: HupE/UreJ family protein [Rhizobiales bacterium]|nr:HupE/UreJ family protein [Hyphomicrobiales bacterium]